MSPILDFTFIGLFLIAVALLVGAFHEEIERFVLNLIDKLTRRKP